MLDKQVMICDAIIDILKIFADSEIGCQFELDYTAIGKYLESARSAVDYFECSTKEEVYERFTEDIYMPDSRYGDSLYCQSGPWIWLSSHSNLSVSKNIK